MSELACSEVIQNLWQIIVIILQTLVFELVTSQPVESNFNMFIIPTVQFSHESVDSGLVMNMILDIVYVYLQSTEK